MHAILLVATILYHIVCFLALIAIVVYLRSISSTLKDSTASTQPLPPTITDPR